MLALWLAMTRLMLADIQKIPYTIPMEQENRLHTRYEEIGRVSAPDICALPGILDDISAQGCKVHYSFPVVVDLETEYEVRISPLHGSNSAPLNLICTPQWVNENGGNTFIGFKINYSPDAQKLKSFIKHLDTISKDNLPDIV